MESKTTNMGRGLLPIRIFVLKVINIEIKILAHPEIVAGMAEQIESVIT